MNFLRQNLRFAGALLVILAVGHHPISKHFRWREESERLSPFSRQVLLVHAFFIALTVGLMGFLALFWTDALIVPSPLGAPVAGGLTIFWAARLYCQLFVYEGDLWRGKRFETAAHVAFTAFWIYLTGLFSWCWLLQRS